MSVVVACPLRRHGMLYVAAVCRRPFDRLLLLRRSFKDATKNSGHAPCRGHSPCATRQGLLRYWSSDPDPARPFGLYHLLHLERSPAGSREEVLCAASSSARALLFEADKNRRVVDSDLLRIFAEAAISCCCLLEVRLARFHLREVFNAQEQFKPRSFLSQAAVDNLLIWRNFSTKGPPREPSMSRLSVAGKLALLGNTGKILN